MLPPDKERPCAVNSSTEERGRGLYKLGNWRGARQEQVKHISSRGSGGWGLPRGARSRRSQMEFQKPSPVEAS